MYITESPESFPPKWMPVRRRKRAKIKDSKAHIRFFWIAL